MSAYPPDRECPAATISLAIPPKLDKPDTLDTLDIMINHDGKTYRTIVDAAEVLKVNRKSLRRYIDQGIVSRPPTINRGLQKVEVFDDEILETMAIELEARREAK